MMALGRDVFPHSVDQAALASAEIGGAAALRMPGGDLALGLIGLLGQAVAVGKPIGPRHAARPIVIVERLDPEIDRARIALQRMRLDDPRLQQLEVGGQRVVAGPAQQAPRADEA